MSSRGSKVHLEEVAKTLQKIMDTDPAAGAQAESLLNAISTHSFVFNLLILEDVFRTTNVLSKYLQSIDILICKAYDMVNATLHSLKELRSDDEFEKYWTLADEICDKFHFDGPNESQLLRQRRIPARLGG